MALTDCQVMEVESGGGPGELWSEREREGRRRKQDGTLCVCVCVSMYTHAKRSMRWRIKSP